MATEIISTVERRRHWPDEEKLRIVTAALAPGAMVAAVADRNGVCRSLLYYWLRLARQGRLPGISFGTKPTAASFVPVEISGSAPPHPSPPLTAPPSSLPVAARPSRRRGTVEITLSNGRTVKVDESIDPAALARLVAVLDTVRS